jgi:hypothetical protein
MGRVACVQEGPHTRHRGSCSPSLFKNKSSLRHTQCHQAPILQFDSMMKRLVGATDEWRTVGRLLRAGSSVRLLVRGGSVGSANGVVHIFSSICMRSQSPAMHLRCIHVGEVSKFPLRGGKTTVIRTRSLHGQGRRRWLGLLLLFHR